MLTLSVERLCWYPAPREQIFVARVHSSGVDRFFQGEFAGVKKIIPLRQCCFCAFIPALGLRNLHLGANLIYNYWLLSFAEGNFHESGLFNRRSGRQSAC